MAELAGLPAEAPTDPEEVEETLRWLMTASTEIVGIIDAL
jgi:hypothetical protein